MRSLRFSGFVGAFWMVLMIQNNSNNVSNVTPFPGLNQFQRAEGRFSSIYKDRQFARAFVFAWDETKFGFTGHAPLSAMDYDRELGELAKLICDDVVAIGYPLVIEDGFVHPLVKRNAKIATNSVGSFIGAPVRDGSGKIVAVLCVIDLMTRTWTEGDTFTIMDFAAQIGVNWEAGLGTGDASEGGTTVRFSPRDPMSRTVAGS